MTGIGTTATLWASAVRAATLLAVVLDVPLGGPVVRRLTREPRVQAWEVGGVPMEVVVPHGTGPWPTWLFMNGAHPERRQEPVVQRLSRGLARAGYLVVVPDLPGLGEGTITPRTLEAACSVVAATAERADARDGKVALIGASTGAALALVAAGRPELAGRISVVAAVAPFADLARMVCLATTREYDEAGRLVPYAVTPLQRLVTARSLAAAVPDDAERGLLLTAIEQADRAGRDPIQALPPPEGMSAEAAAVVRILRNEDHARFRALHSELPPAVRDLFERLSPIASAAAVRAPVELVVPPADLYFPPGEARALAAALPNATLTVTRTLDHTRPELSVSRLRDFAAFGRFVLRGLAAAG